MSVFPALDPLIPSSQSPLPSVPGMLVRCADPESFMTTVEIPFGSPIETLKATLHVQHGFPALSCRVFTAGREWRDSEVIDHRCDDPRLFVFFNPALFPEKSYPAVESAFPFPLTRYGRPPTRPPDEPFLRDPIPRDFGDGVQRHIIPGLGLQDLWFREFSLRDQGSTEAPSLEDFGFGEEEDEPDGFELNGAELNASDIEMTREEAASLRRLAMDGFEFGTALQVFIACDRDENAARECLLSMQ
jgi:hypothetical protein